MPPSQRMGDANSGGGVLTVMMVKKVFVNGRIKSVTFDQGTSHPPCPDNPIHCSGAWFTLHDNMTVFVEGLPAIVTGDIDSCGDVRIGGSENVFIY